MLLLTYSQNDNANRRESILEVMVITKTLLSIFDKYILIKNHLVSDNRNRPVDVHFLKEYASSYEFNVN